MKDGLIVRINSKDIDYQLNLNSDNNTYTLTQAHVNDQNNIRFPLISDGQINYDVLELINHDEGWLFEQIKSAEFETVGEIYLGEYFYGKVILTG